jgi:LmbE family N-acetylglucosaminyl deacetylase
VRTIVIALSHPDDEVLCAGAMAAHASRGDRVVALFLTRGERTEALGPIGADAVAAQRMVHAREAAGIVGAEIRFEAMADTSIEASRESAIVVANVLAELQPDAVVTWGEAWTRGQRHPDHQATGRIVRDAVTLARIASVVAPAPPHRSPSPVFTIRDSHSRLPPLALDVTPHLDAVYGVAAFYRERIGFPPPGWLESRLGRTGASWGIAAAEPYEVWETPGGLRPTLI